MGHTLLLGLVSLSVFSCTGEQPQSKVKEQSSQQPEATTTPMSVPKFSGERAFEFLTQQTSFGPRNLNSPGHQKCLDYLTAELRNLADEVRLQQFTHPGYDGELLRLTNIIATFNPDARSRILLCAHWDTRPRADRDEDLKRRNEPILGANDGASGVAVLLELASLMKEHTPPVGVDIVFFDGEDYGFEGDMQNYLLGSRYFARNKSADYVPQFGVLLDMVGDKFLEIPKEETSVHFAPDIIDLVWRKARELGYFQFIDEIGEAVTDDHLPLNEVGIKTIDLIDFNYPDQTNRYWHTHQDTPDKCSVESLEAVGTVLTHVVYTARP